MRISRRVSACSTAGRYVAARAQFTSEMTTLITFDVDGTLIRSAGDDSNKLHKDAFKQAFMEVFQLDTHIDKLQHHGGTDPLILMKVLMVCHDISKETCMERLEDMKAAMIAHYEANKSREHHKLHVCQLKEEHYASILNACSRGNGLQLLPGVKALLEKLKETPNVRTALVTGNLEPIGWAKMDALGVGHLFTDPRLGGFGSDYCSGNTDEMWHDRAELIRIAKKKSPETIEKVIHVGDTPMDVRAAKDAGALPLGVTTGIFTSEELHSACPDATIVTSLEGDHVLKIFGLS